MALAARRMILLDKEEFPLRRGNGGIPMGMAVGAAGAAKAPTIATESIASFEKKIIFTTRQVRVEVESGRN